MTGDGHPMRTAGPGSRWVAERLGFQLTPLASDVAEVIWHTFLGIDKLPSSNWTKPRRWANPNHVWVTVKGSLGNSHLGGLRRVLVAADSKRLALEISAAGSSYLRLDFYPRDGGIQFAEPGSWQENLKPQCAARLEATP